MLFANSFFSSSFYFLPEVEWLIYYVFCLSIWKFGKVVLLTTFKLELDWVLFSFLLFYWGKLIYLSSKFIFGWLLIFFRLLFSTVSFILLSGEFRDINDFLFNVCSFILIDFSLCYFGDVQTYLSSLLFTLLRKNSGNFLPGFWLLSPFLLLLVDWIFFYMLLFYRFFDFLGLLWLQFLAFDLGLGVIFTCLHF